MSFESTSPCVSVIVPIYNVGRFLDQCLDSIRSQTLRDIEILCLNDGSTDNSLAIIKRHAAQDERIRVIDKANEGYGATCNRGIDQAKGTYVAIVEPDDYLLPDMYEALTSFAEAFFEPIDVVKEAWFDVLAWDDPATERRVPGYLYKRLSTSKAPQAIEAMPVLLEGHPAIWSALYRREFLVECGIRFNEYPGAGWADNPFLIDTLCQARTIVYLDAMHYCYRNELPPETGAAVAEERLVMPLVRWKDMTQALRAYGTVDRAVWQAHYQRGFNYIDDVIAQGGWESERVKGAIVDDMALMERDIVLDHPKLSPAKKRFYVEQTGCEGKSFPVFPYACHLAREFAVRLRAQGCIGAARALGSFAKRKAASPDADKVE
ncbi:glycosyltransferase [Raoultibacter phocaeensis]|uniref:glycosyltransferase n=1 Tax=Raoultibacter phocaeensis TaxID=2479841 RepID=UPI0015D5A146|nr:glycosyltransferase [Raoultibacter phocaeensis]